jgi:hypothetical protein
VALVQKLDGCGHTGKASPYDGHLELWSSIVLWLRREQPFGSCHAWKISSIQHFDPKAIKPLESSNLLLYQKNGAQCRFLTLTWYLELVGVDLH